jgi:hypothetical protein
VPLTLAILIPGLFLIAIGLPLVLSHGAAIAALKGFPRSEGASNLFFGAGALWFLYNIWHLSVADFGDYRVMLLIAFALIAVMAFKCVPDFLAVRGVCILVLLAAAASPMLMAGYMNFDHPLIYFQKAFVYVCIILAIWLGAQPWRLRDFFEWLFARPQRARALGGVLAGYGLLLTLVAFTY